MNFIVKVIVLLIRVADLVEVTEVKALEVSAVTVNVPDKTSI